MQFVAVHDNKIASGGGNGRRSTFDRGFAGDDV